ncbi:hypothetical protein ElyMa_005273400 [Elysia marginata]|uniref:Uncharacterized protein n=1 Tax=Elysia marginata TaxID=1093978 RepID=A0AAV4JXE7_9GAST|nr:hypothetical protein ElyMa_005273400 [Elysia marginata]
MRILTLKTDTTRVLTLKTETIRILTLKTAPLAVVLASLSSFRRRLCLGDADLISANLQPVPAPPGDNHWGTTEITTERKTDRQTDRRTQD